MRTDGRSALDFTYWILENLEENYQAVGTDDIFVPAADGSILQTIIVDCAMICGVDIPRTFSALMAEVNRYGTAVTVEAAMGTRGAILHREGFLTVSVGDEERLVGIDIDGSVSLYQASETERNPAHWDGAFQLPEMRYL